MPSRRSSKSPLSLPPSYHSSSPVPRQDSQTPSSGASGPLSRTFSRLRERSRSKSTSRSKSRPQSLVITNPDLIRDSDDDRSVPAVGGRSRFDDAFTLPRRRTETWEESDEPKAKPEVAKENDENRTPTRLGVLPSPAVESFSMIEHSPTKPGPRVEDVQEEKAADPRSNSTDQGRGLDQEPMLGGLANSTQPSALVQAQPERPQHVRKVSALATLPSQRRSQPGSPRSPTFLRQQNLVDEDDLYETTPTGPKALSPDAELPPRHEDEDDLYSSTMPPSSMQALVAASLATASTPMPRSHQLGHSHEDAGVSHREDQALPGATADNSDPDATHQAVSRPISQDSWERKSEVSAENESSDFVDASEGTDVRSAAAEQSGSRRSSVSSIGSPATVVGKRISYVQSKSNQSLPRGRPQEEPVMTDRAIPAGPAGVQESGQEDRFEGTPFLPSPPPSAPGFEGAQGGRMQRTPPSHILPNIQQRFLNRTYQHNSDMERPMSYMPLGLDARGAPQQDIIDTTADTSGAPVDISAISGPPLGTPPYQQHPLVRNSILHQHPSEYENLRSPRNGSGTSTPAHSRHTSDDGRDRRSKRLSGLFRGPQSPPMNEPAVPTLPPPHQVGADFGLENLRNSFEREATPAMEDEQDKRKSGRWGAFGRTPSMARRDFSAVAPLNSRTNLPSDAAFIAANRARENAAKSKTLQKPQRAASAAVPTEPKKKRFSAIGSLFGRSGTTGHSSQKPKKLTKVQQPSREEPYTPVESGLAPATSVRGYDEFDAQRRQQNRPRESPMYPRPPPSSAHREQAQAATYASAGTDFGMPPPEGWYGPTAEPFSRPSPQPMGPLQRQISPQPQPPSQFRRLHSVEQQRGLQYGQIPESFRPTEASLGRPPAPIGPPAEYQSQSQNAPPNLIRQPTLPTDQPSWVQQRPMMQQQRHPSDNSSNYPLSPQVSGRDDFQRAEWRRGSSLPSLSPMQSGAGAEQYPVPREQGRELTDEELARSPAHEDPRQQPPWPVTMPGAANESQQRGSGMQGSLPPGSYQEVSTYRPSGYASPPPQDGLPMNMQQQRPVYSHPAGDGRALSPPQIPPELERQMGLQQRAYEQGRSPYPSPPYSSPQSPPPQRQPSYGPPPFPQQRQYSGQSDRGYRPPPQQRRYYAGAGPSPVDQRPHPEREWKPISPPPQQQNSMRAGFPGQPMHQRTVSGYSGRRDDMAVSEDELAARMDMRGASYPGQEWSPHPADYE